MPTGLRNSPMPQNAIPTKGSQPAQPQGAINITFQVNVPADGNPVRCPAYRIPRQASVNVRGQNGTAPGNSAPVYVATSYEEVISGGRQVTPDTEIFYPVDNSAEIWVRGAAGDGVQVTITANQIG